MLLPDHLPKKASLIYTPVESAVDIAHFPESSPTLDIINLFNLCETTELLLLNFHSLMWMTLSIILSVNWPLYFLLCEMLHLFSLPIFFLITVFFSYGFVGAPPTFWTLGFVCLFACLLVLYCIRYSHVLSVCLFLLPDHLGKRINEGCRSSETLHSSLIKPDVFGCFLWVM